MINRSKMRRQLYRGGGITSLYPRQKYGIGSWVKERVRKLIPNELADVAVKAAPFVAPFYPGAAALMRGIGRFDQRGSMSDALKQGALTYGFGKVAGKLGGAESGPGFFGGQKYTPQGFSEGPVGRLFQGDKSSGLPGGKGETEIAKREGLGIVQKGVDFIKDKVPLVKKLPDNVAQKLLVGGAIAGASALASYFKGDFRPQEEGESMEEYLAARKDVVGKQMRIYMDNYFKFDPEYSQLDDAGKNAFVARYNVAQGGRIGYQTGGTIMDLVENISDPGSPYYEAAKTLQDRKAQNEAALNLLNTTGTTGTTSMMQQPGETFDDFLARGGDPYYTQNESAIRSGNAPSFEEYLAAHPYEPFYTPELLADMKSKGQTIIPEQVYRDKYIEGLRDEYNRNVSQGTTDFSDFANSIITDGGIKYRIGPGGSKTPIGGINLGGTTFFENAQGRGPGTYDTYDGTTFTAADNFYEMEKDIARRTAPEPASPRTVTPEGTALKVAAPEVAPQRTIAPTIKAEPEGIQTVPTKKVFNVMMDEKGNVMKDQGIAQLARDTGVAPYIQNYPINSMSDVMRMIGPGTGIPQGTEYDSISMDRSLRENVAANEAQRRRVSRMFEAARSRLPGYGPGPVMPMQTNPGYFSNPGVVTQANPGGYASEQEAIADLGIEKYNTMYNQGGRVGQMRGTGPNGLPGIPRMAPDGMEFDMRENGGFQPLGAKEKKDDVPAMLAKNEFVMTADAVRGAGNGDIELGAQKMYDTMKNLERRVT